MYQKRKLSLIITLTLLFILLLNIIYILFGITLHGKLVILIKLNFGLIVSLMYHRWRFSKLILLLVWNPRLEISFVTSIGLFLLVWIKLPLIRIICCARYISLSTTVIIISYGLHLNRTLSPSRVLICIFLLMDSKFYGLSMASIYPSFKISGVLEAFLKYFAY